MKIPSNTLWTQTNQGDILGVLHSTKNVSLDTTGKLKGSKKPMSVISSVGDAQLSYPLAFTYFDGAYHIVTSDGIFIGDLQGAQWTEEIDFSPATTLGSDAVIFNDLMYVTADTTFTTWDGAGDDIYSLGSLTSGVPHPMCIFDSNSTYKLAIGNGNLVQTYNSSNSVNSTVLTLPSQFEVTSLRYRNGYLYVGTKETTGGEARIFIWNGSGTNAQYEVPVGCSWVFSMTEYGSTVAAIVSSGQLIQVSGAGYTQLAALPVYYNPHTVWQGSSGLQLNGKVFNRGMVTVGDQIYINIDGETATGFIPEMKTGIWVYDPEVGLYHKTSSSTDRTLRNTSPSLTDNTLTITAHGLKTGDAVVFNGLSGLVGINIDTPYYVTVITANTIKLSNTRKAVEEQRYVVMSGTPAVGDILVIAANSDYGSEEATSGAVMATVYNETAQENYSSEIIWGCRTNSPAGVATYVVNVFSDQYNISRFETQRIYSKNIKQNWKEVYAFIDGVKNSVEEIIVKVQTKPDRPALLLTGVWESVNVLNTSNTEYTSAWGDIEVGEELVITDGIGQGRTVHVTAISNSSTIYSITVDEAIGTIGSNSTFYATAFSKVTTFTKDNTLEDYIKVMLVSKNSTWIKIALELRGFTPAVNMLELSNEVDKGTQ